MLFFTGMSSVSFKKNLICLSLTFNFSTSQFPLCNSPLTLLLNQPINYLTPKINFNEFLKNFSVYTVVQRISTVGNLVDVPYVERNREG